MTTDTVVETNDKPLTMDTLMARVDAILEKSSAKIEHDLDVSSAKFRRDLDESSARFQRDLAQSNAEASARSDAEWKKWREEWRKEWDKGMQELKNSQAETDKIVKQNAKQLGGIGNNLGAETTEFFYNSFKYGNKEIFGEKFDDVFTEEKRKTIKGYEDEYDILLFNGQAVCIIEVKTKADTSDVLDMGRKKITFRKNFPEHNAKRLYLAMASKKFHPLTEKACKENGIAMIKQVGNTVAIFDENLKTF